MTLNTNLLNAVKDHVIAFANANNINLHDEFESVDAFKKFLISLTITTAMETLGWELPQAYDAVMGSGAYQELADSIWEANQ